MWSSKMPKPPSRRFYGHQSFYLDTGEDSEFELYPILEDFHDKVVQEAELDTVFQRRVRNGGGAATAGVGTALFYEPLVCNKINYELLD
jgi:hypothetical protein